MGPGLLSATGRGPWARSVRAKLLAKVGGVPERSKGTDCKSVGIAFGGSNPPPSTIFLLGNRLSGNSSVARASAFQAEGRGFESRFPLHFSRAARPAPDRAPASRTKGSIAFENLRLTPAGGPL